MKNLHDSAALHGVGATALVTLAGLEEFGVKLATSVVIALLSTGASLLVKYISKRMSKGTKHDDS
jgi:hypothetical protein